MEVVLTETKTKIEQAFIAIENKFSNVRAGRANPGVLEGLKVSYYGADTPLIQLASILVPDARTLTIKPFDKTVLGNIEKAIFEADLGFTPNNNGETITINIPLLTQERRAEYVKQTKVIMEEGRINLRNIRQESNNNIKKMKLAEDEEKRVLEKIQELIDKANQKIEVLYKNKEAELMTM